MESLEGQRTSSANRRIVSANYNCLTTRVIYGSLRTREWVKGGPIDQSDHLERKSDEFAPRIKSLADDALVLLSNLRIRDERNSRVLSAIILNAIFNGRPLSRDSSIVESCVEPIAANLR